MNNWERAMKAQAAVDVYWGAQGTEELTMKIGDLVCDLMHLLDMDPGDLGLPEPPPELDSGYRNKHAGSGRPVVVLARSLNHYLAEIHPDSLLDGEGGEHPVMDPLPADVDDALRTIAEFFDREV